MQRPRIYADFNGLNRSPRDPAKVALSLEYRGTLEDLSRLKVRLTEGLEVTVYSDSAEGEDLEAHAIVFFDRERRHWLADFEEGSIRYESAPGTPPGPTFPCFHCGADLKSQVSKGGLRMGDLCANCGGSIHEPILPPS